MVLVGRWGRWLFSIDVCPLRVERLLAVCIRPSSCWSSDRSFTVHHSQHHCFHQSLILHSADVPKQSEFSLLYQIYHTIVSFNSLSDGLITDFKFGENVSNTLQDIMLTMFRDAHMDGRMRRQTGQKHYASGHTSLGGGGGIKTQVNNNRVCQL